MSTIKTFGSVDARSLDQLKRCMDAGDAEFGVLCADHHPGYSQPIGGGIAYEGHGSPSGGGYGRLGPRAARRLPVGSGGGSAGPAGTGTAIASSRLRCSARSTPMPA